MSPWKMELCGGKGIFVNWKLHCSRGREQKLWEGMDEVKGQLLAPLLAQQCWNSSSPLFINRLPGKVLCSLQQVWSEEEDA